MHIHMRRARADLEAALEAEGEHRGLLVIVGPDAGETPSMTSDRAWEFARILSLEAAPGVSSAPSDSEQAMAWCRAKVWAEHCGCSYGAAPQCMRPPHRPQEAAGGNRPPQCHPPPPPPPRIRSGRDMMTPVVLDEIV